MRRDSDKIKKTRTYAILGAVAVLAIALGVLLGGKISGVLFSGQDLFTDTETPVQTVQATPVPFHITSAPIAAPSATAATGEASIQPSNGVAPVDTPAPVVTADPYEELARKADTNMMNGIVNILFIGVDYEAARLDKSWGERAGTPSIPT